MGYYVGLDVSSTNTGVVIIDKKGKLVYSHLISPEKTLLLEDRATIIITTLSAILREYDISHICIEAPSYGSIGKVVQLAQLNGGVLYSVKTVGMPITSVPPTTLKKFATDNGRANKEAMVEALPKKVRQKFETISKKIDDLADAYHLAKYAILKDKYD